MLTRRQLWRRTAIKHANKFTASYPWRAEESSIGDTFITVFESLEQALSSQERIQHSPPIPKTRAPRTRKVRFLDVVSHVYVPHCSEILNKNELFYSAMDMERMRREFIREVIDYAHRNSMCVDDAKKAVSKQMQSIDVNDVAALSCALLEDAWAEVTSNTIDSRIPIPAWKIHHLLLST